MRNTWDTILTDQSQHNNTDLSIIKILQHSIKEYYRSPKVRRGREDTLIISNKLCTPRVTLSVTNSVGYNLFLHIALKSHLKRSFYVRGHTSNNTYCAVFVGYKGLCGTRHVASILLHKSLQSAIKITRALPKNCDNSCIYYIPLQFLLP